MMVLLPKSKSGEEARASGVAKVEDRRIAEATDAVRNLEKLSFFMLRAVTLCFPVGAAVKAEVLDIAKEATTAVKAVTLTILKLIERGRSLVIDGVSMMCDVCRSTGD